MQMKKRGVVDIWKIIYYILKLRISQLMSRNLGKKRDRDIISSGTTFKLDGRKSSKGIDSKSIEVGLA